MNETKNYHKRIELKRPTHFLGRNGVFKCIGIDLLLRTDGKIEISPITSQDKIGRCNVSIFKEDLPELIKTLKNIGNNIS